MQVKNDKLSFSPFLPNQWKSYSFNITFRGVLINVLVNTDGICLSNYSSHNVRINVFDEHCDINSNAQIFVAHKVRV